MFQRSFFDHAALGVFYAVGNYKRIRVDLYYFCIEFVQLKAGDYCVDDVYIIAFSMTAKATFTFING